MRSSAKHLADPARASRPPRRTVAALLAVAFVALAALPLSAASGQSQNQKKNKKDSDATTIASPVAMPDGQAIDLLVSQMLGAWQIGDVEMMHKYYADDVVVVSGAWEPPLIGWENYQRAYASQRARTVGGRLDRSNSYTKVLGDTAWVNYQWQYTGEVDGVPTTAYGHTTLALEKRAGSWLITLNHTSTVPAPARTAAAAPAPQTSLR